MIHLKHAAVAAALLAGAVLPASAQQSTARSTDPAKPLGFFVTSEGVGKGGNLGGLAGADAQCQKLAATVGAGNRTWHAYLSTQPSEGQPAVNARDRIGQGPWYNTRGAVVARDVAHLHGDTLDAARLGNNLTRATVFTEKNEPVKGFGDRPNEHDIITGSAPDGRAFADAADHTCRNYTSSAPDASTQLGHFDRTGGGNTSWNSAHASRGCGQENLVSTGGAGLLYCFAVN
ncbi:MAG: lectin [Massilia sp.]